MKMYYSSKNNLIRDLLFTIGLLLLSLNVYGLFQDIEPENFDESDLRFLKNERLTSSEFFSRHALLINKSNIEYIHGISELIFSRMHHIQWNELKDPTKYNQLIPIYENYILFLIGYFQLDNNYVKYHFADYERSIRRGIGICGDASMITSQLLDIKKIENRIISFPGHVIVEAVSNGRAFLIDSDFGVVVESSVKSISLNREKIIKAYSLKGYNKIEIDYLINQYTTKTHQKWNGVDHFIKKKFYFEYFSYYLIWILPLLCILLALYHKKIYYGE